MTLSSVVTECGWAHLADKCLDAAALSWNQIRIKKGSHNCLPFTGCGVETLLTNCHQVIGVNGLEVDCHLLNPLLQGKPTACAACMHSE